MNSKENEGADGYGNNASHNPTNGDLVHGTTTCVLVALLVRLFLVLGTWSRLERAYQNIFIFAQRDPECSGPGALVPEAFGWSHSR